MPTNRIAPLRRPSGALAMLAIDQGEPLRGMLARACKADPAGKVSEVPDQTLVDFKVRVVRALSPLASAVLLDQRFSWEVVTTGGALADRCAPMLSADRFLSLDGDPLSTTELDPDVDLVRAAQEGARAAKLLIVWREDEPAAARLALGRTFVESCVRAGLASALEVICKSPRRGPAWVWDPDALAAAARELGGLGTDLYLGQVPLQGVGSDEQILSGCRGLHAAIACPWAVLSSDVAPADFSRALRLSCLAGASGFLAGRVIWGPSVGADDLDAALFADAVPRLLQLVAVVDEAVGDRDRR